jgi:hypothetical protein
MENVSIRVILKLIVDVGLRVFDAQCSGLSDHSNAGVPRREIMMEAERDLRQEKFSSFIRQNTFFMRIRISPIIDRKML